MRTRTVVAVAVPALLGACQVVEETGRSQFTLYPEGFMVEMGLAAYEEATAGYEVVVGTPEAEMVQRVGRKIAAASGRDYAWEFRLLAAPDVVNAFALPGGKVAVYTGILPVTRNEDGLAAVLGHEVAHATSHHGNERMTQGLVAGLTLAVAEAAVDSWSDASAETKEGIMAVLGAGATLGYILPYSRTHEAEADEIGLRFLIRAGYDPWEAPRLWERMAALGGARPPEFFSTHPDPERRARDLRARIPQLLREEGRAGARE